MSDYTRITINIALEAANDPFYEPPNPLEPSTTQQTCEDWVTCTNPYCLKHGCLNTLHKQGEEAQS